MVGQAYGELPKDLNPNNIEYFPGNIRQGSKIFLTLCREPKDDEIRNVARYLGKHISESRGREYRISSGSRGGKFIVFVDVAWCDQAGASFGEFYRVRKIDEDMAPEGIMIEEERDCNLEGLLEGFIEDITPS